MKNTLRFFALLDVVSIALLSRQIFQIATHLDQWPVQTLSQVHIVALALVYVSLFFSAIGLFQHKLYGLVTYYIQFPFRLLVWVFSFGFLTFISQYFNNPLVFDWLFRLVIMLEFFRLYFTIRIHRRYF